MLALCKSI